MSDLVGTVVGHTRLDRRSGFLTRFAYVPDVSAAKMS